jgi:hypothetical protein
VNLNVTNSETVLISGYSFIPVSVWLPVEWTHIIYLFSFHESVQDYKIHIDMEIVKFA